MSDVAALVEQWEDFVTSLQDEFDDDWDEYLFYLNLRDAITHSIDALNSHQRSRLTQADGLFRVLTTDYTMARMPAVVARVPLRPGKQLAADLKAFGWVPVVDP